MQYRFNACIFAAVNMARSNEDTRYYLRGVFVKPAPSGKGVIMCATDGARMVVAWDCAGFISEPAILDADKSVLAHCKATKAGHAVIAKDEADSIARVIQVDSDGDEMATLGAGVITVVDGTFPDFDRVIPREFGEHAGKAYNAAFLSDFGKIAKKLSGDTIRKPAIRVRHGKGDGSPDLVTFGDLPGFGVIMPMRWHGGDDLADPIATYDTHNTAAASIAAE